MKLIRDLKVNMAFALVNNDIIYLDGHLAITTSTKDKKDPYDYFIICTDSKIARVTSLSLVQKYFEGERSDARV